MAATVWRGRLAFGMVSIPVRLHKAARRERIRFRRMYRPAEEPSDEPEPEETRPAPSNIREFPAAKGQRAVAPPMPDVPPPEPVPLQRVRNMPVAESGEDRIEEREILKGYEIEKDRFVTFAPQEVAALRPRTSSEVDISEFVRLQEIDPIYFETSYYAAPENGGEKAYALLYRALAESGYAAIGSLAMHGREHATIIRPGKRGLIVQTLFYENEVRAEEEYQTDAALVNPKELDLAKTLVRAMATPFDAAKLKDTFEERLKELIQARAEEAVSLYERGEAPKKAPVVDIMEALRKSLEMAKKPVGTEKGAKAQPAKRASERGRRAKQ